MTATFAIIAAGGMGSALGRRLAETGTRVLTAMEGRSAASRQRAEAAGMEDVGFDRLAEADVFLSVVPPDQALPLAERMAEALRGAPRRPVYVDCNAVGPALAGEIEAVAVAAGFAFVDAGIIGLHRRRARSGRRSSCRARMPVAPQSLATSAFASTCFRRRTAPRRR